MAVDPKQALEDYLLEWEVIKREHRKKIQRLRYAADDGGKRTYQREYRKKNRDKVRWNDAKFSMARSLGMPASLIPDELIEAKVRQLDVERAIKRRADRTTQAIEAGTGETRQRLDGDSHESAVPNGDASK